jgi:hypothetical protein
VFSIAEGTLGLRRLFASTALLFPQLERFVPLRYPNSYQLESM